MANNGAVCSTGRRLQLGELDRKTQKLENLVYWDSGKHNPRTAVFTLQKSSAIAPAPESDPVSFNQSATLPHRNPLASTYKRLEHPVHPLCSYQAFVVYRDSHSLTPYQAKHIKSPARPRSGCEQGHQRWSQARHWRTVNIDRTASAILCLHAQTVWWCCRGGRVLARALPTISPLSSPPSQRAASVATRDKHRTLNPERYSPLRRAPGCTPCRRRARRRD